MQQGIDLVVLERVVFVGVGEEQIEAGAGVVEGHVGLLGEFVGEPDFERLVDHVVDDFPGRVERAGLLAGRGAGFGVIGGQEVLEHAPEQLGIERDFLLDQRVLGNGELVGLEDVEQAADAV